MRDSETQRVTEAQGREWRIAFVASRGAGNVPPGSPVPSGQELPILTVEMPRGTLPEMSEAELLQVIERKTRRGR